MGQKNYWMSGCRMWRLTHCVIRLHIQRKRYHTLLSYNITKKRLFKYIENFTSKIWKFSDKKFWYFSYVCSKHRLWVLCEAILTSTHNLCFCAEVIKNNVYPCELQFYHIKVGFKGVKLYGHVFVMNNISIGDHILQELSSVFSMLLTGYLSIV